MTSVMPRRDRSTLTKPTADERKRAELNVLKAGVQIAVKHSFFSTLLMQARTTLDDSVPTACVDARGNVRIGTAFAASLTVTQMMTVRAHEILHPALGHFERRMARDPREWNIAGDKVINAMLAAAGFDPIEGWVFQHGADKFSVEELYQDPTGEGSGQGQGDYDPGNGTDDMDQTPMTPEEEREVRETWRVNVAQAKAVAKQMGQMPGSLEKLVDAIITPYIPYQELLERWMQQFVKGDYSWARPNKKYIGNGVYLPSAAKQPAMGTLVIQSDESGSISEEELQHFAGNISKIIETCRPELVIVLHTDTVVHEHVDEFTLDDLPLQFKSYGCGGTDMRAGIKWVQEHGIEPEAFVTLTDGCTPWPTEDPGFPLMWVCTTDQVAPIGETIRYRMEG